MNHIYCPECGFQSPASANYCPRCGALQPEAGRTLIGRSPECEIFLDDVTVSRRHAELERVGDMFTIRDLGSLNGTYVNRRRIESAVLENDDEVQIGKYRLTFLRR